VLGELKMNKELTSKKRAQKYRIPAEERKETCGFGFDLPRTDCKRKESTDELAPPDIDVFGEQTGQIVRERDTVASYIGSNVSESEAKASKEFGGAVGPQRDNVERIPKNLPEDNLGRRSYHRPENLRQSDDDWNSDCLCDPGPTRTATISGNVGHVDGKGYIDNKQGTKSDKLHLLAFPEMVAVMVEQKTKPTVLPLIILLGMLKRGPQPCPAVSAHVKSATPKKGITATLTMNIQRRAGTLR
jgi:hypothetical protein